jgi:hypothetical protein
MTASNVFGRQVVLPLTNKSGGSVAAGDVVILDTTNNDAFTTTTAAATTAIVGIATGTIANNAVGLVLFSGYASLVNVNASVTRGHYGTTFTVAKQATDGGATRITGAFCQFLTGGTTPDAIIYNPDLGGASLTNPMTTKGDIILGDTGGTPTRLGAGTNLYVLTAAGAGNFPAWAAVSAAAMSLIASSVLGSPAASFSFTSISGAYNHLRLVVVSRCTASVFDSSVALQFNADTAANYDRFSGRDASATTLGATEAFAQTSAMIGSHIGATGPANIPGICIADIPLYAGTTFHKTGWFNAGEVSTSTGNDRLGFGTFNWRSTAAITRVDVITLTGTTFATGSAAYLYGII